MANVFDQFDAPKPAADTGSYWSKAITDIPGQAWKSGSEMAKSALEDVKAPFTSPHETTGSYIGDIGQSLQRAGRFGRGLVEAAGVVPAAVYGGLSAPVARGEAALIHQAGKVLAPDIAAKQDPEQIYRDIQPDVEQALGTVRPRRGVPGAGRAPNTGELFDASTGNYAAARGYGVEIAPQHVSRLADDIFSDLGNDGFRERNIPKTWSAIDELKNPAGRTVTVDDIESVRKVLNRAGANPLEGAEREASRRAISAIDDYMADLGQNQHHVVVNPQFAGQGATSTPTWPDR